jgi:hypothetical protein
MDPKMIRSYFRALALVIFPLVAGGSLHAECLPTLGTDDCGRSWDARIQPMEHYYLDVPAHRARQVGVRRHARDERPKTP